jgi:hypothetical protein
MLTGSALLLALRLEFYFLHPAFQTLLYFIKRQTGDSSPEEDYANHINKFVSAAQELDGKSPEMEFIAEIVERLWKDSRELALQIANVRTLKGLMPI